ncbi:MAG: MMPL family transporter [Gammaproteobacteria bacterium]|jgi:HAE1 family hydrophobic/amphiphilic exporter-1|nr:MMPL family transporter [Gammaproteobacteria bacterium]
MNRLPRLAIRRPVTTCMVFLSLAVFGMIATKLLPLEFFPDVDFPGMMVEIPYPGSSPEEVEQLIARPVEEALATMDDIQRMITNVGQDSVRMFVFFGWDADMDARGVEAKDKIDGIRHRLPEDVDHVFVRRFTSTNDPILGLRIGSSRDLSDAWELLDRNVRRRLERIEGVASVEIDGVDPREVRILLHADRVAAHGVDINALRERLRGANFSVSAGYVDDETAGRRIRVTPLGTFTGIDEIRRLPIDDRGLRLGDIAEVSVESPPRRYERLLDGQFAVGVNIFSESGANLVEVSERVLDEVDAINELPDMAGINLFVLFSQAEGVVQSLRDLALAGLIGALMSMVVLYVFLRQWATTLIVMLSVPSAVLITLGAMYFLGLSLNILTMMGLMLAVGMLVDNAVVVTESIYRCRQRFPDQPGRATLLGVREVAMAVTAGTLTTIIVFLPNIFGAQNEITSFLSFVAYAITVALLASLLISQTMIPLLTLKVPAPPEPRAGGWLDRLTNAYARVLDFSLRRRWITALAVFALLASAVVPLGQVKTNMFQQAEGDRIMLHYNVVGTYSLERVRRSVDRIETYLRDNREAFGFESLYSYYSEDRAETTLILDPDRDVSNEAIRERVREGLPAIAIGQPGFEAQRGTGGETLSLTLHGESSERLFELSEEVARVLSTVDGLVDVRSDATAGAEEVQVRVDRQRAIRHGLSSQQVAQAIAVAMRGERLNEFRGPEGELTMRLAFHGGDRQSAAQLANLPLVNDRGERIRLATVADFQTVGGPANVFRLDRRTSLNINMNIADLSMGEAREAISALMEQVALPPGYGWSFGEAFQREDEAMGQMAFNMLLAIALIFIVMAALFESTLFPASIVTSILFSFIGVFWFFFLTGTEMSLMAMIGMLVLMGIVVNNGIVLIDHVNNLRRRGMPRDEAVIQAGRDRLRPILMTAATTILAMIPLALGQTRIGGDGPPYFPMARAVIGGLAFSTVVSLVVVPFVYVLLDRLRGWAAFVRCQAGERRGAMRP